MSGRSRQHQAATPAPVSWPITACTGSYQAAATMPGASRTKCARRSESEPKRRSVFDPP